MSSIYLQATYHLSYYFPLPEGMCSCDLNNKTKVKEYFFAANELHIIFESFANFRNGYHCVIRPEKRYDIDMPLDKQYDRKPDSWFPIVKEWYVNDEYEYFADNDFSLFNHDDDDDYRCPHKQE